MRATPSVGSAGEITPFQTEQPPLPHSLLQDPPQLLDQAAVGFEITVGQSLLRSAVQIGGSIDQLLQFAIHLRLGLFASFLVWAIFGALLLAPQLSGEVSGVSILYAVLSLTVVRMVPPSLRRR